MCIRVYTIIYIFTYLYIILYIHISESPLKFRGRGWGYSFCKKNSDTPTKWYKIEENLYRVHFSIS